MITALVGAAALLLLGAGAAKVVEPNRTVGALAALGWPASPGVVRAGAAVEAVIGAATLAVGGRALAAAVAVSYAGFVVFVVTALRSDVPIGTCACFGRPDTPPRMLHAVIDAGFAGAAVAGAAIGAAPLVEAGPAAALGAVVVAIAAYLALTHRSGVSQTEDSG
jgi:hypothetical protein